MTGRVAIDGALALVTGAGSGIGRATAIALAGRGARLLCADINDLGAAETVAACRSAGASFAEAVDLDVADRAAMEQVADSVTDEFGALDILVNNAGVGMTGRFTDMTAEDWRWIRSVNLDGVVNGCAAFAPAMLARRRGHVVNVSSGLAYTFLATVPAYSATKAAVLAMSRCLRADWAASGVGVTAVCPGVVNTPIIDSTRFLGSQAEPAVRDKTVQLFRRGHDPTKVGSAIVTAIERDRPVAVVGADAWALWVLSRVLPLRAQQRLANLPLP